MNGNLGKVDRVIRLVLGLALYVFFIVTRNYLGLLGFVLILTAGIAWCPIYALLHLHTSQPLGTGTLAHKH